MSGSRLKISLVAAVAAFAAGAAQAADYSPPQCYDASAIAGGSAPGRGACYAPPQPVVLEEYAGWYLRSYIGISNQRVSSSSDVRRLPVSLSSYGFDSASIFGTGIGYYFNDWARFDITGEYRRRANFHGHKSYKPSLGTRPTSTAEASRNCFSCPTPMPTSEKGTNNAVCRFRHRLFRATRSQFPGCLPWLRGIRQTALCLPKKFALGFCRALHAGLAYKVSKNFFVELSYRYLDMGKGGNGIDCAYEFRTLHGRRWMA